MSERKWAFVLAVGISCTYAIVLGLLDPWSLSPFPHPVILFAVLWFGGDLIAHWRER